MGKIDQSEIETWLKQGVNAAKTGQRDQAQQWLQKVLTADRTNVNAWLWLSAVVDNKAHQRRCLENVLTLDPHNKHAWAGLEKLATTTGQIRQTVASPTAPQKETPPAHPPLSADQCPFCQQPISALDSRCGHCQIDLTITCPQCTNKIDVEHPTCPQCGYPLGECSDGAAYFQKLLQAYKKSDHAAAMLSTAKALQYFAPNDIALQVVQGKAEITLGQTEAATQTLQAVLAKTPNNVEASLALGGLYHQLNQWDEARETYKQALIATPDSAEIHYAAGWLFMEEGQINRAIKYFQSTLKLQPDHGWAWLRLGQIYDAQNQPRQASKAYQQAIARLPPALIVSQNAQQRLAALNPELPRHLTTGWTELIRRMLGPTLICLILVLLDSGLSPSGVTPINGLLLILAVFGAFLWASGSSASRNPLMRRLLAGEELPPTAQKALLWIGATCWFIAFVLIVLPFGRVMPEVPL